jgi:hypothetical protein
VVDAFRGKGVAAYGEAIDVSDKAALEGWVAIAAKVLGSIGSRWV